SVRTARAVRIGRRTIVRRLVARLRAVAIAIRSRTGVAGVDGTRAAAERIGAVAEEPVSTTRSIGIGRGTVTRLEPRARARLRAVSVPVGARTRIARTRGANARLAGVARGAEIPFRARRAVRLVGLRLVAHAAAVALRILALIRTVGARRGRIRAGGADHEVVVQAGVRRAAAGIGARAFAGAVAEVARLARALERARRR